MTHADLKRRLLWHGAFLLFLGLVGGFLALAPLKNPRMMVGTHIGAVLGAVLLMALGLAAETLHLGPKAAAALFWTAVFGNYALFVTGVYAAAVGTSAVFAAPPGLKGTPLQEVLVMAGNVSASVSVLATSVLLLWGLRSRGR